MITVGKPFREKNSTLQNLHNVLSNQDDYSTLTMQVLTGADHHNSNSETLLPAPVLQTELNCTNTSPSLPFIVILQLENLLWFYKPWEKQPCRMLPIFDINISNMEKQPG